MVAKAKTESVELKKVTIQRIELRVIGDTSLIMHKFSEKAKKQMLDKMMLKAKKGKEPKNPEQEYLDATYFTTDGKYGFPATAFKAAMVRAAKQMGMVMMDVKCAMFVEPYDGELVVIEGDPVMREDPVPVGISGYDLRYRPEFLKWSSKFTIKYNPNIVSAEQIVNMLDMAGFGVGVGEWRPEKDGIHGTFHVEVE